jgi:hypothetical protein
LQQCENFGCQKDRWPSPDDLKMVTLGTFFEYFGLLSLPAYLIYLSLYRLPAQEQLGERVRVNQQKFAFLDPGTTKWRVTMYQVLTPEIPEEAEFHYALEVNMGKRFRPKWRKVYVEAAQDSKSFLRQARTAGPRLVDALRAPDHFCVDGIKQTIRFGIFAICSVMFIDLMIYYHYFPF